MYKVGLTGGIASGKSTVLDWLKAKGITYIDADQVAREVVQKGSPCLGEIVDLFGEEILLETGELNRPKLGAIVFGSQERLDALNGIIQGYIRSRIYELTAHYEREGHKAVLYDIPLMFETPWHTYVDEVWLVYVDRDTQLRRLMERNQYTEAEALQRMSSQMLLDEKVGKSQYVINNSGTVAELHDQLERLWKEKSHLFEES